MCFPIPTKPAISSEGETRRYDMWWSHTLDANRNLDPFSFDEGARFLLCIIDVVHYSVWKSRAGARFDCGCIDAHQCAYNILQTFDGESDRRTSKDCRVANGLLSCSGNNIFGGSF